MEEELTPCEVDSLTQPTHDDLDTDTEAPDGGWGWMVLVGCFMINFVSGGCANSFGVLFTELVDYFEESKSKTAWTGSLFYSVPLLCGPIASVITARVGCRKATILGGVIAFFGFISSGIMQSLEGLYFTYGIVAGLGIAFPYLTTIIIISHYFRTRLAFATGVSECGAGIGTIVFAPVTEALLETYGWRGTMYILAAILGNIIVCGALFRPLKQRPRSWKVGSCDAAMDQLNDKSKPCTDIATGSKQYNYEAAREGNVAIKLLTENNIQDTYSLNCVQKDNDMTELAAARRDQQSRGYISRTRCHKCIASMKLSIFKHPIFLLFVVSSFILYFWFDTPFVFLANRAVKLEMSEARAALLVSVIGVLHTLGNLLFGIAGDIRRLSLPLLYGVSIAVCGASLLLVPSFSTFLPLAILAGMFGLFSAASEALSSILLIDILGEEYLSESYGFTMLLKGIANLIGPPVSDSVSSENLRCPCFKQLKVKIEVFDKINTLSAGPSEPMG